MSETSFGLKPCPRCGSRVIHEVVRDNGVSVSVKMQCASCGFTTQPSSISRPNGLFQDVVKKARNSWQLARYESKIQKEAAQ